MKYKFEIPKHHKIDKTMALVIHGGMCPSVNVIYLYGYSTIDNIEADEAYLYGLLLEHEHLHSILHRFGIPLKYHEKILLCVR